MARKKTKMTRKMKINPQSKNRRSVCTIWRRAKLVQRSSLKLMERVRPRARAWWRAWRRARLVILRKLVYQMIRTQPNGENKKTSITLNALKLLRQKLVGHKERLLQTNTYPPKGCTKKGFDQSKATWWAPQADRVEDRGLRNRLRSKWPSIR